MSQENTSSNELKLPPIPDTVRECLSQMYSSEADLSKLGNLIQKDLAITSNVLKLANSAIYSAGKSTSDLKVGITRIGLTSLMQILVKYTMENMFKFDVFQFFNIKAFTKHSSWVSSIGFELGRIANSNQLPDLLLAGLMHDIGLVVRAVLDKNAMKQVTDKCIKEKIDFSAAERNLKIEEHESLGCKLLTKWQFPEEVVLLVKYHHSKEGARPNTLTHEQNRNINLLMLADVVAHRFGAAFTNYTRDTRVNSMNLELLGLTNSDVTDAVKKAATLLKSY